MIDNPFKDDRLEYLKCPNCGKEVIRGRTVNCITVYEFENVGHEFLEVEPYEHFGFVELADKERSVRFFSHPFSFKKHKCEGGNS